MSTSHYILFPNGSSKDIVGWRPFIQKHRGCRIQWGHWYRVMTRRTEPESLVLKCRNCNEQLHSRIPHPRHS
jgi:hypothetical protein